MAAWRWKGLSEGTRQSLPVYITLANINEAVFLSSFMLLTLAASPLSLPLLWGIDRVRIRATFCLLLHDPLPEPRFFLKSMLVMQIFHNKGGCTRLTTKFVHFPRLFSTQI